ncbi:MAG: NAD-dependent epimerase/dehydratase family protein [Polyangiaceae bacterium]
MKRALVTGANGHIGSNVVRDLLDHEYEVVAMVRPNADRRGLEGLRVVERKGDVLDAASVRAAVEGCSHVFHLAAPYITWARDPDSIIAPAVLGTENVLRAAKSAGVERVVVTGSCNAVGFTKGEPLDETTFRAAARSPYMRAKREQELRAVELARELGLHVTVVLPTTVLGPYDYRKTPTTAAMVDVLRGKQPVPFPMNLVDVRDVAAGHRLAAEHGASGERYLLGGSDTTMGELATLVEAQTGKRPKEGLPPEWVLRAVAAVSETVARISGKAPIISDAVLDDVAGGVPLFRIDKAKKNLGYAPRGPGEVIAATHQWARTMNWV